MSFFLRKCTLKLRHLIIQTRGGQVTFLCFYKKHLYRDFTLPVKKNQDGTVEKRQLKNTKVGKEIFSKYTPKKDLNRKAANYMEKHMNVKSIVRFETCSDFMRFLTTQALDKKRLENSNSCGNRFCPICTWKTAKKDAIKLSIMLDAVKELEAKEFIFLTLTAPNCTGEELSSEIDRFNQAISKLFRRRNVERVVKGYIRKLEVTTDQEQYITAKSYKRKQVYFDKRGLKEGDPNPQYNTYNPHVHIILAVNKSYFTSRDYIDRDQWLTMWKSCMDDERITQVDIRKIRNSENGKSNAVLEIAKYSAKGSDLYHSESVFDTFYISLKKRQLLVYSGVFKDYSAKYNKGELNRFKKQDETVYTHLLRSLWKGSNYENKLRELTPDEFKRYNERAEFIEESDQVE